MLVGAASVRPPAPQPGTVHVARACSVGRLCHLRHRAAPRVLGPDSPARVVGIQDHRAEGTPNANALEFLGSSCNSHSSPPSCAYSPRSSSPTGHGSSPANDWPRCTAHRCGCDPGAGRGDGCRAQPGCARRRARGHRPGSPRHGRHRSLVGLVYAYSIRFLAWGQRHRGRHGPGAGGVAASLEASAFGQPRSCVGSPPSPARASPPLAVLVAVDALKGCRSRCFFGRSASAPCRSGPSTWRPSRPSDKPRCLRSPLSS